MSDPIAAQASIDALLDLPRSLAGESSGALDAALVKLEALRPSQAEFGDLLTAAHTALQTVCSSLVVLHDAAIERERAQVYRDTLVLQEETARVRDELAAQRAAQKS